MDNRASDRGVRAAGRRASTIPRTAGPLARHGRIATASVDEFCVQTSKLLSTHTIDRTGRADRTPFQGQVRAAQLGDLQLVYLEHGVDMDVDIVERIDYYDLMFGVAGTNDLVSEGIHTQVDTVRGALLSPTMRARMRMDAAYRQMHLRIDQHVLDRRLETMIGRPVHHPVVFDLPVDLGSPQLSGWASSLRLLIRDLDNDNGLAAHPLTAASWQDLLVTGLLLGQPHNYTSTLRKLDAAPAVHPRALRKALSYCEEHLTEPVTVRDIADHVGVSVRSLQRAFQEKVGTSPSRHIQSLRLARARRDILDIDPDSASSVTEIAYRWGFVHLSRFAAAYKQRYGETPSATRARVIDG